MGRQLLLYRKEIIFPISLSIYKLSTPDMGSSAFPSSSFSYSWVGTWLDFISILRKFTVLKYNSRQDILHLHKLSGAIKYYSTVIQRGNEKSLETLWFEQLRRNKWICELTVIYMHMRVCVYVPTNYLCNKTYKWPSDLHHE